MPGYLFDALSWSGDEDDFLQQVQFAWRGFTATQQRYQGHWYPELTLLKRHTALFTTFSLSLLLFLCVCVMYLFCACVGLADVKGAMVRAGVSKPAGAE